MSKFGLYNNNKNDVIKSLMKQPMKEKKALQPTADPWTKKGAVHQADLLHLPTDNGYKYALVVVDVGSRLCDAEPLTNKRQIDIINAFKLIYSRKILKYPTALLQVDQGAEFGKATKKHFNDNKIMVRYSKVGRSRQQAIVEAYNRTIAKGLFYAQYQEELKTNQLNTEWVDNLPKLIKEINKHVRKVMKNKKKPSLEFRCEGKTCDILEIGQKVRVKLDKPRELTGEKLHGRFRATDLRWDKTIRKINNIILRPAQPVMYSVEGIDNVNYTYEQLQLVK